MRWLALVLCACNQLLDIPEPAPACAPGSPFRRITPVGSLNTPDQQEHQVWLTRDERTAVVTREDPSTLGDLLIAHRAERDAPFGETVLLDELSTPSDEFRASMTADGLTIYFDRNQGQGFQIFEASRATADARFGPARPTLVIDEIAHNFEPFITADGLYFSSTRGPNGTTLHYAPRTSTGFGAPYPLIAHSNSVSNETPVVSADGLEIFYAYTADGHAADIWTAARASPTEPFGAGHAVAEINSEVLDSPSWISPDSCRLYVSSKRGGTEDLWLAERTP